MPASVIIAGQKPRSKLDFLLGGVAQGIEQRREAEALRDILGADPVGGQPQMQGAGLQVPGIAGGQFDVPSGGVPMPQAPIGQGNIRFEDGFPATGQQQPRQRTREDIIQDRATRLQNLKSQAQRIMMDPRLSPGAKQRAMQMLDMQFQFESQQQALEDQRFAVGEERKASESERAKSAVVSQVMGQLPAEADAREVFRALTGAGLSVDEALKVAGKFTKDASGNSKAITMQNQVGNILSRMKAQIGNIQKEISVQDALGNIVLDFSGEKGRAAKGKMDKLTQDAFKAIKRIYEKEGLEVPSDIMASLQDFEAAGKAQEQEKQAELDEIFGGF